MANVAAIAHGRKQTKKDLAYERNGGERVYRDKDSLGLLSESRS